MKADITPFFDIVLLSVFLFRCSFAQLFTLEVFSINPDGLNSRSGRKTVSPIVQGIELSPRSK